MFYRERDASGASPVTSLSLPIVCGARDGSIGGGGGDAHIGGGEWSGGGRST